MRPLVIVRPEPGASATARAARRLGLKPVVRPLFKIEPIAWQAPAPADFDALVLTSANALRAGGPLLERFRALPAYCVGEATAAAARAAGFAVAATGPGNVDELLAMLPPGLRLLHPCGEDRREPAAPRQPITAVPVYRSAELPPEGLGKDLAGSVIAVHSPRAAARVRMIADSAQLPRDAIAIVAISAEAAAEAGDGWQSVNCASQPTDSALLALASSLCNNG